MIEPRTVTEDKNRRKHTCSLTLGMYWRCQDARLLPCAPGLWLGNLWSGDAPPLAGLVLNRNLDVHGMSGSR